MSPHPYHSDHLFPLTTVLSRTSFIELGYKKDRVDAEQTLVVRNRRKLKQPDEGRSEMDSKVSFVVVVVVSGYVVEDAITSVPVVTHGSRMTGLAQQRTAPINHRTKIGHDYQKIECDLHPRSSIIEPLELM